AAAGDPLSTSHEAAEMGYEGSLAAENAPDAEQAMAETAAILASFNINLQARATETIANMGRWSDQAWSITAISTAFAANLQGMADRIISNGLSLARSLADAAARAGAITVPSASLPGYASGGFANSPSIFAEDGLEAAIPIDGSARSVSLWQRTGELLGVGSGGGGDITINANFTVNGVTNAEIIPALERQQKSFVEQLKDALHEQRRVSYSY
ncbi:MAG: hypothetical protein GX425_13425, partial [Peptococcaceae bacterium]|nr:hypothetical protein [Peptococcaceae bacterium]